MKKQPLEVFHKKAVLKNFAIFTGKYLRWSLFSIRLQAFWLATLLKRKETPTQVFSCEFYEFFKSTYFEKHLRTAVSARNVFFSTKLKSISIVPNFMKVSRKLWQCFFLIWFLILTTCGFRQRGSPPMLLILLFFNFLSRNSESIFKYLLLKQEKLQIQTHHHYISIHIFLSVPVFSDDWVTHLNQFRMLLEAAMLRCSTKQRNS